MAVLMSIGPEATGAADGTSSPLNAIHDFKLIFLNTYLNIRHDEFLDARLLKTTSYIIVSRRAILSLTLKSQSQLGFHDIFSLIIDMLINHAHLRRITFDQRCGAMLILSLMSKDALIHFFTVTASQMDGTRTWLSLQVSVQPQLSSMLFQKLSQVVKSSQFYFLGRSSMPDRMWIYWPQQLTTGCGRQLLLLGLSWGGGGNPALQSPNLIPTWYGCTFWAWEWCKIFLRFGIIRPQWSGPQKYFNWPMTIYVWQDTYHFQYDTITDGGVAPQYSRTYTSSRPNSTQSVSNWPTKIWIIICT